MNSKIGKGKIKIESVMEGYKRSLLVVVGSYEDIKSVERFEEDEVESAKSLARKNTGIVNYLDIGNAHSLDYMEGIYCVVRRTGFGVEEIGV